MNAPHATLNLGVIKGQWISLATIQTLNESDAREVFLNLRWKDGIVCPYCAWDRVYEYRKRPIFKCAKCGAQFSETTNTFFRYRKLSYRTILCALAVLKAGSNAHRLSKAVKINYRTAVSIARYVNSVINLPPPPPLERHNPRDTLYPYIISRSTKGKELLLAVNNAVPRSLPEQIRSEICQDIIVAILSGEIDPSELAEKNKHFIRKAFALFPTKYGPLSLDHPAPWMGDTDTPLIEMLDAETHQWGAII